MLSVAGWAHACAGFKFIGNTALNLVADGYEVPFGYEEAIGYMFGSEIRDKDGVAASVSDLDRSLDARLTARRRWCSPSW